MSEGSPTDAGHGPDRPGQDADDTALLLGVAAERMDCFETLYRRYHPRVSRFLRRMIAQAALAEEALDDTMLVIWRRAHTYDPGKKASTWIFGIAYRQALKALRRADEVVESPPDEVQSDGADPGEVAQRGQRSLLIRRALGTLPAEQRAAVEMTYFLGYSYREIAQVMDCPVDTVKTRMFHARRRLRMLLGERCREVL